MNAAILCVGKLKESWQREGCAEYLKRLSRYGKYEIIQVDDLREPDNASPAQIRQIVDKEGQALLSRIRPNDRVVALCIRAKAPDSLGLAEQVRGWTAGGRRTVFVIGGSTGILRLFIEMLFMGAMMLLTLRTFRMLARARGAVILPDRTDAVHLAHCQRIHFHRLVKRRVHADGRNHLGTSRFFILTIIPCSTILCKRSGLRYGIPAARSPSSPRPALQGTSRAAPRSSPPHAARWSARCGGRGRAPGPGTGCPSRSAGGRGAH